MADEVVVGDEVPQSSELIEVHVSELERLFNPIDPSPLPDRDLDSKTEEFIVSWAQGTRRDASLALMVYVDNATATHQAEHVGAAIREFFAQRSISARRRLSQLFRVGRTSLLIGLLFLTAAVVIGSMVDSALSGRRIGALIRESILIGGWVAMWRPLEIFLYDWWPILAERKMFDRLSRMSVCITLKSSPDAKR